MCYFQGWLKRHAALLPIFGTHPLETQLPCRKSVTCCEKVQVGHGREWDHLWELCGTTRRTKVFSDLPAQPSHQLSAAKWMIPHNVTWRRRTSQLNPAPKPDSKNHELISWLLYWAARFWGSCYTAIDNWNWKRKAILGRGNSIRKYTGVRGHLMQARNSV